jgi:hypothetical protein
MAMASQDPFRHFRGDFGGALGKRFGGYWRIGQRAERPVA